MRLKRISDIFKKEVLDTLRDRRTLLMMVVIPLLLYPGLMILLSELSSAQQAKMEQKTLSVALVNVPQDSPLIQYLKREEKLRIVSSKDPVSDVRAGLIHYVLQMPSGLEQILQKDQSASVKLLYDRANDDSTTNLERIQKVIESFNEEILKIRLKKKSLTKDYIHPVVIEEINVASKQKMGGFVIGRFLPMLMVIMVLAGSMYPAIDMTAGEKERGTLETILTSPATRTEIVLGKFVTVTLIALVTGLLNLGSMMATFSFGIFREVASTIQIKIPLSYLFIMVACLLPLAIFFSGMMMAVSSFARSFKEAQNFLTPIYLIGTLPAFLSTIPGVQLEGFWLVLPVANVALLFKELMLGVFDLNHIFFVLFSAVFLASAAIFLAVTLFGREEVLFGEVSSFGLAFRRRNIAPKDTPEPSEALFFIIISLALLFYVAIPLQSRDLISGLIITELLIFLFLPIAYAAYLKLDFKKTFRLRMPSLRSISLTLLIFAGIECMAGTILYIQNLFFPLPQQLIDFMEKMMKSMQNRPLHEVFVLLALLPAVCEEATFRGVLLSGMLNRSKPWRAILITAFLFAVFHLSLYRFIPVFLIGIAASFLVWYSGSIFTGILLHLLNNSLVTFLANYPQFDKLGLVQARFSLPLFVTGIVLIGLSVLVAKKVRGRAH